MITRLVARRAGATVLAGAALLLAAGCATRSSTGSAWGTATRPAATPGATPTAGQKPAGVMAATLESTDQRLTAALLYLAASPTADAHRAVAREYLRLGVRDTAHEHFTEAVRLDPGDASSYDAMARIWRDWGTPHLGLGDAYRAVHFAPHSAAAANTLGTLLQALGRLDAAKRWYAKALDLDGSAWYALNNICYLEIMTKQRTAVETCSAAVRAAAGTSRAPQNNLALAHAAAGDMRVAQQWFRRAGDPATASYNYGMTLMATGNYAQALTAFQASLDADPQSSLAAARARQARSAATNRSVGDDHR